MSKRRSSTDVGRRNFLKGASLAAGAAALAPAAARAQAIAPAPDLKAAVPGPLQIAAELHPPTPSSVTQSTSGGDFMVDVLQGARHRLPRDELRLELPRPA